MSHDHQCAECAAERRHVEMANILSDISQTLVALLGEIRSDTSLNTVVDKLESIRYTLNNR